MKDIRSLVVSLFFVPLGRLKGEDRFKETHMTMLHNELLIRCLKHDFKWIDDLINLSFMDE